MYGKFALNAEELSKIYSDVVLDSESYSRSVFCVHGISHSFEDQYFEFSFKKTLFGHKSEDASCRICSYGP